MGSVAMLERYVSLAVLLFISLTCMIFFPPVLLTFLMVLAETTVGCHLIPVNKAQINTWEARDEVTIILRVDMRDIGSAVAVKME